MEESLYYSECSSEFNSFDDNETQLEIDGFEEFDADGCEDSGIRRKAKFQSSSTQITSLQFDDRAEFLAAGTRNGSINIYNLNFGELESQIDPAQLDNYTQIEINQNSGKSNVTGLKWKPQRIFPREASTLAASYGDGLIKFWDVTKKECKVKIEESEIAGVYSIDYNLSGSMLASGGIDWTLRVYDEPTKSLIVNYAPRGCGEILNHFNKIFGVKFDPKDDKIIYSGGADKIITMHDTRCKFPIRNISGPYIIGDSIDISGHSLLAGSYRCEEGIEVWDLRNYERLSAFNWNSSDSKVGGQVVSAKFLETSDKNIIAASKIDNEVKVFDSKTGDTTGLISGFHSMIYSLDISHTGNYISVGNADGTISLFDQ